MKGFALKGHGSSRAARKEEKNTASAAEGAQIVEKNFPQGLKATVIFDGFTARLKPCPFKTLTDLRHG